MSNQLTKVIYILIMIGVGWLIADNFNLATSIYKNKYCIFMIEKKYYIREFEPIVCIEFPRNMESWELSPKEYEK